MAFNNRVFLKVLELAISLACIALIEDTTFYTSKPLLVCGTVVAFGVVGIALTITHLINAAIDKRIDMLLSILGVGLFIATGSIVLHEWDNATWIFQDQRKNKVLSIGVICILNGITYLVDLFFTFRS